MYKKESSRLRVLTVQLIAEVMPYVRNPVKKEQDFIDLTESVERTIQQYLQEGNHRTGTLRGGESTGNNTLDGGGV